MGRSGKECQELELGLGELVCACQAKVKRLGAGVPSGQVDQVLLGGGGGKLELTVEEKGNCRKERRRGHEEKGIDRMHYGCVSVIEKEVMNRGKRS